MEQHADPHHKIPARTVAAEYDLFPVNPQLFPILPGPDRYVIAFIKPCGKRMLRRHAVIYIQNFAPGCQRQLPAEQFVILRALFDKSASVQIDHQRNLFFTALCAYKKRL